MAESLVAQSQSAAVLPALLDGLSTEVDLRRFNTPYLIFAQPAAKAQWTELIRTFPDIESGDPVLFLPKPEPPVHIQHLKVSVIVAKEYFAERDVLRGGIDVKAFSVKMPGRVQRILAVLVVYMSDRAVPATCLFKTTKCEAVPIVVNEVNLAKEPEWTKNGVGFEAAVAAFPESYACFRVVATIHVGHKTSRRSGQSYDPTQTVCSPIGVEEMMLLKRDVFTENGWADMEAVISAYKDRLEALKIDG